jgi:hypothetical protein
MSKRDLLWVIENAPKMDLTGINLILNPLEIQLKEKPKPGWRDEYNLNVKMVAILNERKKEILEEKRKRELSDCEYLIERYEENVQSLKDRWPLSKSRPNIRAKNEIIELEKKIEILKERRNELSNL